MPLCSQCKAEAEVTTREPETPKRVKSIQSFFRNRDPDPVEECDECDRCGR